MAALSKHQEIFQRLHQGILRHDHRPGERLPSEVALSRRFGVSRPTVAQALHELQRLGLVERRPGAGSFVRNAPDTGMLGLMADGLGATEIADPLSAELTRAAHAAGWGLRMGGAIGDRDPEAVAAEWAQRGVAGVFFAPLELHPVRSAMNQALVERFARHGLAVVLLDRDISEFPERSEHDLVAIDDFFAGYELAAHILGRGCRRLAFVARPAFPATTDLRLAGVRAAVTRTEGAGIDFCAGVPSDAAWVRMLLRQTTCDAIVCSNDATAAQLLPILKRLRRRVPADIRIAGFDDVRDAKLLSPPLTTMRQPCAALAAAAVDAMITRLRQPHAPARRILLRAELIVRASTGG